MLCRHNCSRNFLELQHMSSQTSDENKIVHNLTPKRLKIRGNDKWVLELAPLEKNRRLQPSELECFDHRSLELQNLIKIEDEQKEDAGSKFAEALPSVGVILFFVFGLGHNFTKGNPTVNRWFWIGGIAVTMLVTVAIGLVLWKGSLVAKRLVAQFFSLVLIMAFGIALPGLIIYNFNGGRELIANKSSLLLLGRGLQFIFIIAASLLPALLYFLFDRQELRTLRDRFEQQIFRLDPNVKTLVEVKAKYGKQLAELYGSELDTGEGRLIRATRWPIFMATLVITLGSLLALVPADRTVDIKQASDLANFFLPQR